MQLTQLIRFSTSPDFVNIVVVVLVGCVSEWMAGCTYKFGWFTIAMNALFAWLSASIWFPVKKLHPFLRGFCAVFTGYVLLPAMSGIVQLPYVGLQFLSTVGLNVMFVLTQAIVPLIIGGVFVGWVVRKLQNRDENSNKVV
jgi:hypothetical protein